MHARRLAAGLAAAVLVLGAGIAHAQNATTLPATPAAPADLPSNWRPA